MSRDDAEALRLYRSITGDESEDSRIILHDIILAARHDRPLIGLREGLESDCIEYTSCRIDSIKIARRAIKHRHQESGLISLDISEMN